MAEKLGRKWIATDLGKFGIHTTRKRLIQVQRELKAAGKPFRAFEVLNLGRYERQAYLNVSTRLTGKRKAAALARKEQEFRELILKAYRADPLGGRVGDASLPGRDGSPSRPFGDEFFHGKLAGRLVVVGPINLPVGRLFVEEVSKDKQGVVTRENLTKRWTDWVDYWAVDFDYQSRKEIIKVAKNLGVEGALPGTADTGEFIDFEERWTGGYIFENEWQSFRARKDRNLELTTVAHTYDKPGRYTVAVKVIDIFGNDTMTLVPVTVG